MDEIPKPPPQPILKPSKPQQEEFIKATPEKAGHVRFYVPKRGEKSEGCIKGITSEAYDGLYEPQINSTQFLQARIANLCQDSSRSQRHMVKQVLLNETNQNEVNEKASSAVNFKKGMHKYNNLTSLDINSGEIASLASKPRKSIPVKPRTEVNPSQIMAFFSPDLITEKPEMNFEINDLDEENVKPPECTFDYLSELYRLREKTI